MQLPVLAIGSNPEIMETLLRLINKNPNWTARGALSPEEAIAVFDHFKPALVLLCNGISDSSEKALRTYFTAKNPAVSIIQHYGGGSGLLTNEILQALDKNK